MQEKQKAHRPGGDEKQYEPGVSHSPLNRILQDRANGLFVGIANPDARLNVAVLVLGKNVLG